MAGEIVMQIQEAAAKNPEKAAMLVQQLKSQWGTLSAEQKQQAMASLKDVQAKAASLSPDQRKELATAISALG